jgi:hypothetical protein
LSRSPKSQSHEKSTKPPLPISSPGAIDEFAELSPTQRAAVSSV